MSLLKSIKQKISQNPDAAVSEELDLSQIKIVKFTDQIKKYLQKFKKVAYLTLRKCELESLQNLPKWKLHGIDLSDNNLRDDAIQVLINYPTLNQILAPENHIQNLDSLKPLAKLKELTELDLSDNPVSANSNYSQTLFKSIETLQVLDHKDKDGNAVEEEEEEEFVDDSQDQEFDGDGDDESEDYEEEEEESESEKPKKKKK